MPLFKTYKLLIQKKKIFQNITQLSSRHCKST